MTNVVVSGCFDNIQSRNIRFLEEAAKIGALTILLWSDNACQQVKGRKPDFPQAERQYFLESVRYVQKVILADGMVGLDEIPQVEGVNPDIWAVPENEATFAKLHFCATYGIKYTVIKEEDLAGFPVLKNGEDTVTSRKKVLVTGCYDWFHSGHVRFFEETSGMGDLYVVVGNDANVRLLKGEGHPLFSEQERRYMAQSIRFVKQAQVSSGNGWMDAEPEIEQIKPDYYAVNEDGDKPEKKQFCQEHGIAYVVLKRIPKAGLMSRQSTDFRGF
ncbi:MAG: adenylyltransferase/cytidyltransferase family protein [Anaerolineales bacterium]|jgi:cytidyltransferase-like protein